MRTTRLQLSLLALYAAFAGVTVHAQPPAAPTTRPATNPAKAGYEVVEWLVLVADPNVSQANAATMFKSTLPSFADTRRPPADDEAATAAQPMPVGVVRFAGLPEERAQKVDVLVEAKGGRFLSRWPQARSSADRELWQNLELTRDDAGTQPVDANHWFAALRKPDATWLARGGRAERFLLYDLELPFTSPLRLSGGKDATYDATNAGPHPLHGLQLYKPTGPGWRTGGTESLVPASGTPAPQQVAPPTPQPSPAPSTDEEKRKLAEAAAQAVLAEAEGRADAPARPAPPAPSPPPATQPATLSVTKIALAPQPAPDAAQVLSPWRDHLAQQGLPPADVDTILAILARHALDKDNLTAVYRMGPAELDALIKLEVIPEPRKVTRVALVIVRNIDPALVEQLDALIAQLGDDDWNKREAAQKKLAQVGGLAKPKLEAALSHKDLEVVWRAERLLAALAAPTPPRPGQ